MSALKSLLPLTVLLTWSMVWWPADAAEAKGDAGGGSSVLPAAGGCCSGDSGTVAGCFQGGILGACRCGHRNGLFSRLRARRQCEARPASGCTCGGEPRPVEATVTRCPMYMYMNHGSYCSYYSLLSPTCGQPASLDATCGLTPGCSSPYANCVTCMLRKSGTAAKTVSGVTHTHERLAKEGFDPNNISDVPDWTVVTKCTSITVEFCKEVGGGGVPCNPPKLRYARVFEVDVKPTVSKHPPKTFYVGHQIDEPPTVDLSVDKVKTIVAAPGTRVSVIEFPFGAATVECNILLRKTEPQHP
jgi:hypothetical protein